MALTPDQIASLAKSTLEKEYIAHAKRAAGDDLWTRLDLDQRIALTEIAYNLWGFKLFKEESWPLLREAISEDLLRDPAEGDCRWASTRDAINANRPKQAKLAKRYDKIVEGFTGCSAWP